MILLQITGELLIKNNEGQGLTWRQVKINSKNLQKLMKKRGLSQFDTMQLKKVVCKVGWSE